MKLALSFTALMSLALSVSLEARGPQPQDPIKGGPPKVDQAKVDAAIKKGIAYLKAQRHDAIGEELVLLTLVHGGVGEDDPVFRTLLQRILDKKLEKTYNVSIQAMVLEEVDRVAHQGRIWQCAQFLADNQLSSGQWTYGEATMYDKDIPTGGKSAKKDDIATGTGERALPRNRQGKPAVVRKLPVTKRRTPSGQGDNSNSQYAVLGLRACHDAGIVFQEGVVRLTQKWWRDSQNGGDKLKKDLSAPAGWSYPNDISAYGSMSAGALGSLVICDYMLKEDSARDRNVIGGMNWLARNFSVTENPLAPPEYRTTWGHYYYLYALERAGILCDTERFGAREWYPEGAQFLLKAQREDGAWAAKTEPSPTCDTCWAILFLRRATRPLVDVASEDRAHPKGKK